jgi:hypothetical protein
MLALTRVEIMNWGCSRVSTEDRWKNLNQELAGGLGAHSSRVEAGPVRQENEFTQPSGHGV